MSVEPIAIGVIDETPTLDTCERLFREGERDERRGQLKQAVALQLVRDQRLYLEHFATFEEYVEKRLGYTKGWASQRISLATTAAQFTNVNTPAITNEGQARAIKPVLRDHGPEIAAEVLREAADDDGKLTARSISEAATRVIEPEIVDAEVIDEEPPVLTSQQWMAREGYTAPAPVTSLLTPDERALQADLQAGHTVVLNMRDDAHARLWQWAVERGLAERIDRKSVWGNPFILGDDGDRDTVCDAYANVYLPHKPRLLREIADLKGRALGCWCAPARCHGDHLAELAARS